MKLKNQIVLGINYGHDSGAALVINDQIKYCINEERLSRVKMHNGFPFLSIDYVLSNSFIRYSDIDVIAIEGQRFIPTKNISFDKFGDIKKFLINLFKVDQFLLSTYFGLLIIRFILFPYTFFIKTKIYFYFKKMGFNGRIEYFDHHFCHATTAYYTQNRDDGIAITLDASGEGICSRVYLCRNGLMQETNKVYSYNSPAYYYAYITKLLGFTPIRHEGKITGLAALGDPSITSKIFKEFFYYEKNNLNFKNIGGFHSVAMSALKAKLSNYSREDIAAGIQSYLESTVVDYIDDCIKTFSNGQSNIFLSGGLFANVKLNMRVINLLSVKSLYVFPNMGDGGLALGAALAYLKKKIIPKNFYLGAPYSVDEIKKSIDRYKLKYIHSDSPAIHIAEFLVRNKIVAIFQNEMEYGPRALGNRSILYSASDQSVNTFLNKKLNRSEFMPFAPVVRDVDACDFFILKNEKSNYEHMTICCEVNGECEKVAPAVVHVDRTARPQIISRATNPLYYDILSEYANLCNNKILVNTSFNMHEEPIVSCPDEAISTFLKSSLDVLLLNNFIITKES